MKLNKTKYLIAIAVLFLATAAHTDVKAQWDAQSTPEYETLGKTAVPKNGEREPFSDGPSYAPPPGGDDSQKEIPVPGGLWILAGLAVVYSLIQRSRTKYRKNINC